MEAEYKRLAAAANFRNFLSMATPLFATPDTWPTSLPSEQIRVPLQHAISTPQEPFTRE